MLLLKLINVSVVAFVVDVYIVTLSSTFGTIKNTSDACVCLNFANTMIEIFTFFSCQ
jgi:hypothetical protein